MASLVDPPNPYSAPAVRPNTPSSGAGHATANIVLLVMLALSYVAFAASMVSVLFVGSPAWHEPPLSRVLPFAIAWIVAVGVGAAAAAFGLHGRARWAPNLATVVWLLASFNVWPIPFAVYPLITLHHPAVRRLFVQRATGV